MVMGSSAGHGSFLFELQQNLIAERRRQEQALVQGQRNSQSQGQMKVQQGQMKGQGDQQQVYLPGPPKSPPATLPVSQEEVLLNLHD